MKRFVVGAAALVGLMAGAVPADAAWNNVFQPTLFGRSRQPTVTNYYYVQPQVVQASPIVASPTSGCTSCGSPPPAAPQSNCSTSYSQRCYYQPVTTYESRSYYEPVTTYRTSYYYEPVTSYSYSCYYDPCSCSYKQVATPTTSYSLRAQSCPVQSWVQRCAQVPVTSYQKSCYWQPQTTCCSTTEGTPVAMAQPPVSAPAPAPLASPLPPVTNAPAPSVPPPPSVNEQRTPPPGPSGPASGSPLFDRYYGPTGTTTTNKSWIPGPTLSAPIPANDPQPAPAVKLEGIVQATDSNVRGQVVRGDNAPRANADILFVSQESGLRRQIRANEAGQFETNLPNGTWLVYMPTSTGAPAYHARVQVGGQAAAPITLVNR